MKFNFCIEKLSIGDNDFGGENMDKDKHKEMIEQIQQSVIFNTQYNQMKDSNKKFEGFAHDLIAESLKEWARESEFVKDKLN